MTHSYWSFSIQLRLTSSSRPSFTTNSWLFSPPYPQPTHSHKKEHTFILLHSPYWITITHFLCLSTSRTNGNLIKGFKHDRNSSRKAKWMIIIDNEKESGKAVWPKASREGVYWNNYLREDMVMKQGHGNESRKFSKLCHPIEHYYFLSCLDCHNSNLSKWYIEYNFLFLKSQLVLVKNKLKSSLSFSLSE